MYVPVLLATGNSVEEKKGGVCTGSLETGTYGRVRVLLEG